MEVSKKKFSKHYIAAVRKDLEASMKSVNSVMLQCHRIPRLAQWIKEAALTSLEQRISHSFFPADFPVPFPCSSEHEVHWEKLEILTVAKKEYMQRMNCVCKALKLKPLKAGHPYSAFEVDLRYYVIGVDAVRNNKDF